MVTDDREQPADAKKYKNEKPISLYPLTPEEALRRAMSVPPPPKTKRPPVKKAEGD